MPENPQDMDLEQRRKQLEERRRLLEQRRQEISRQKQGPGVAASAPPPPATPPPPEAPRPTPTPTAPPPKPQSPPPREERPKTPGSSAMAPPPPKPVVKPQAPAPKPKAPEPPAPKPSPKPKEKAPPSAKPEIARAAAPPKRSPLPLIVGGGLVVLALAVGIVIMTSGKKAEQAQEIEQARIDSLRIAHEAQAAEESARDELEARANTTMQALRDKLQEADRLQAGKRAKGDYDRANEFLDEATRLVAAGDPQSAEQRAKVGLEHIDSAIDRSRRAQEREDLAQRDRDQALARLRGEVEALQESLGVLRTDRGPSFAATQVQQLEQIVGKARSMADAGNLGGAQDQVSYAYDMVSKVRIAIGDGLRQEEEARRLLEERRAQAIQDSIDRAKAEQAQKALPPTRPVAVKQVAPVYPRAAEAAGISGTVEVEFEVGVDGRARDFKVVKSLGAGCDESAIDALKQWEFEPATQGGKPVPTRIRFPIVFKRR